MTKTPAIFTALFEYAELVLSRALLPTLDPDGDPPPMLFALLDESSEPAVIALPPILTDEKDLFASALAAMVQALEPVAFAFVTPAWLRSSTPNKEIILVSCQSRELSALGLFEVKREEIAPPSLINPMPPEASDVEAGRFAGAYWQDTSALPQDMREAIIANASQIRAQHQAHMRGQKAH